MHTNRSLLRMASRAAAFSFLMAGAVSLMQAQQPSPAPASAPLFLAAASAPFNLTAPADTAYSSSSSGALSGSESDPSLSFKSALDASQPPPRRRYGRPNYSDSHTNPDGSSKFAFMAGAGLATATQDTGKYLTDGYVFQVGAGRNFSKMVGVLVQFDWNNFGFQRSTVANQLNLYNSQIAAFNAQNENNQIPPFTQIGGSSHVWSFTVDPTLTFYSGEKSGAYVVGGVGFYHKTASFTTPSVQEYCDPFYGCVQYQANSVVDDYTSNAVGFNGGLGLTYKPSRFSGEKFYLEARYVFVDNSPRAGYNASTNPNSTNFYPPNANQTYYVPVTFGLRF